MVPPQIQLTTSRFPVFPLPINASSLRVGVWRKLNFSCLHGYIALKAKLREVGYFKLIAEWSAWSRLSVTDFTGLLYQFQYEQTKYTYWPFAQSTYPCSNVMFPNFPLDRWWVILRERERERERERCTHVIVPATACSTISTTPLS